MSEDLLSNKNILRPHLLWSGQRCFRVVGDYTQSSRREMIEEREIVDVMDTAPMQFDQDTSPLTNSDTKCLTWKILMLDSGVFEARLSISSIYYGFICGTKNMKRLELEKETKTKILLPKSNSNTKEIVVVTGSSANAVDRACARISMLMTEKRKKSGVTHFVSIPLTSEVICTSFVNFKKTVINYPGIDEDLFQSPMKLHLTLAVLTLLEPSEIDGAKSAISQFVESEVRSCITKGNPIKFKLQGLEIMCDDPSSVDVLYGCVQESEGSAMIQQIADKLTRMLENAGYLSWNARTEVQPQVKLHATLMNSRFKRLKLESAGQQGNRIKCSFNASKILKNHSSFEFGWASAEKLLLCVRGTKDPNGAHECISDHKFTT